MTPKKLHRFFIDKVPNDAVFQITDERIVHQVKNVLRFAIGESFIVFENNGDDIIVSILELSKKELTVEKQSVQAQAATPPRELIAAISIVKRDNFELIVQKLTELGVSTIVPIISARTVKDAVRLDRLQLISDEAVEQCGGNKRITITEPQTIAECVRNYPYPAVVFAPTGTQTISSLPEKLIMFVGPEGGWSSEDDTCFAAHEVTTVSLGARVLRTETAAIVGAYTLLWK